MDEKTKELIAIGASVGAHCQDCLKYHVAKAKDLGVQESDIADAIEVGHMVEKGAASIMRKFSKSLMSGVMQPVNVKKCCSGGGTDSGKGCCC